MKLILSISLCLLLSFGSFAQDCYQTFYDNGVKAYNTLDFETAINQFEAAKICDDSPANNALDAWINKAQNGYIDAIKAEQVKSQSLALTAKSIIELLKRNDATKAFRYAQQAWEKDDTPESRAALYECFYQLESPSRKNFYIRNVEVFPGLSNSIRTAGLIDGGKTVYIAGEIDNALVLYDFAGQMIAELDSEVHWFDENAYSEKTGLLLTTEKKNGKHFLVGRRLRNAKLAPNPVFEYASPDTDITAAAVSKDGSRIVISSYKGVTQVLDSLGRLRYELPAERSGAEYLSFANDHHVALSYDKPLKVIRLKDQDYEILMDTVENNMYDARISLSPMANYLMTAHGRRSSIWHVKGDSTVAKSAKLNYQLDVGMFSADEKYATFGHQFLNMEDGYLVTNFPQEVRNMKFSPDFRYMVANIGGKRARIWRNNNYDKQDFGVLGGHKDFIRQISFSPDSTHLLTASIDNTFKLWNARLSAASQIWNAGTVQGAFAVGDDMVVAISRKNEMFYINQHGIFRNSHYFPVKTVKAVAKDGKHILSNTEDGFEVWTLDIAANKTEYISGISGTDTVRQAAFFTDDRLAYYSDANYTYSFQIWNFEEGGIQYLSGYDTGLETFSVSPDNRHVVAVDSRGNLYLWQTLKGQAPVLQQTWTPHPDHGCNHVEFSKDSRRIVTSGNDNIANVWDLEGNLQTRLIDHIGRIHEAAFSPDGQHIVTASQDRTAKVWTADGELVVTLEAFDMPVLSVRFSDDGRYIVTNFLEHTVMIWPFDPQLIIDYMEDYQLPELTEKESK